MVRSAAWIVLSLVVSLCHFLRPAHADDAAIAKEQAKLKGIWVLTSIEFFGKEITEVANDQIEYSFRDGEVTVRSNLPGMKEQKIFFRINPTTTPKLIDVAETAEGLTTGKAKKEGIYKIEKDVMHWCMNQADGMNRRDRPTEFKTSPDTRIIIYKLKRISD